MQEEIRQQWVKALKKFDKDNKNLMKIKLPLKIPTAAGEIKSAAGILCDIHAEETGTKWQYYDSVEDFKFKDYEGKQYSSVYYLGENQLLPPAILEWAELGDNFLHYLYQAFDYGDFKDTINMLENPDTFIERFGPLFERSWNGKKEKGTTQKGRKAKNTRA